jgi:hypothetical protein
MSPRRQVMQVWWRLTSAVLLLSAGAASAQTPWPDYISKMEPGVSQSPVSVMVWSTNNERPAADVPASKARWSGKWAGYVCMHQLCETKLIVEKVTATGATILYGIASQKTKPYTARLNAIFVGDELQATLRSGAKLAYRMRPEGDVEFLIQTASGKVETPGILSKEK